MTPDLIDASTGKILGKVPALPNITTDRSDRSVAILRPVAHLAPGMGADPFGAAKYWIDGARRAEVMGAFARIMAGFALRAAQHELHVTEGARTDKSTDPRLEGGWKGFLKRECGISPDTASNWMKLSKLAEPKIKKLGKLDAQTLLNLSALDPAQVLAVQGTLQKVFKDTNYGQLMLELGLVKKKAKTPATQPEPELPPDPETPTDGWRHGAKLWRVYAEAALDPEREPEAKAVEQMLPLLNEVKDYLGELEKLSGDLPEIFRLELKAHAKELAERLPGATKAPKGTKTLSP